MVSVVLDSGIMGLSSRRALDVAKQGPSGLRRHHIEAVFLLEVEKWAE
jgi:hypothetical protein